MKKIILGLSVVAVALLTSCGSDTDNKTTNTTNPNTANNAAPASNPAPAPQSNQPVQINAGQPAAGQPAANANVKDPNPEHGQPGHRCDIPVGASLSSAPAAPQGQPQIQMNPAPVTK